MTTIQCTQHTYPRSPAYINNARQAPIPTICKLPDDILLKIATELDLVSLAQLQLTTTKAHTLFYTTLNCLKDEIYLQTHKTCLEKALTHLKKIDLTGRPLFLRRQANISIWELDTPNPDLCDQKSLCLKAKSCARIAHLYKEIDHHFAEELFENAKLHANGITDRDIKRETQSYIQLQKHTIAFTTRQKFIDARYQIKQYIKLQEGLIRGSQLRPINRSELSALTDLSLEQTKTNLNSAKEICRKAICVAMKEPDLAERDRLLSKICLAQIKTDETLDQKEAHETLNMIIYDKFVDLTRLQLTTKQAILEPNQKKDIAMAQANQMKVPEFQIQAYCNIALTKATRDPKDAIKTLEKAIHLLETKNINLAESRESNQTNKNALLCYLCLIHTQIDPTLNQEETIKLIDNIQDETLKIIILCFIASKCWQQTQK